MELVRSILLPLRREAYNFSYLEGSSSLHASGRSCVFSKACHIFCVGPTLLILVDDGFRAKNCLPLRDGHVLEGSSVVEG